MIVIYDCFVPSSRQMPNIVIPNDIVMDDFPEDEFDSILDEIVDDEISGLGNQVIPETPLEQDNTNHPINESHEQHQLWEKVHIAGLLHTASLTEPTTSVHRILSTGLRLTGTYREGPVPNYKELQTERIEDKYTNVFKRIKMHLSTILTFIITVNYLPQLDRLAKRHNNPQLSSRLAKPQGLPTELTKKLKEEISIHLMEAQHRITNANCNQLQNGIQHHKVALFNLLATVTNDVESTLINRAITVIYNRILNALITKTRHLVTLQPSPDFKLLTVSEYVEPNRRKQSSTENDDDNDDSDNAKRDGRDAVEVDAKVRQSKQPSKRPTPNTNKGNGKRLKASTGTKKTLGQSRKNGQMGIGNTTSPAANTSTAKKHSKRSKHDNTRKL